MNPIDPTVPRWPRWLAPQSIAWGLTRPVLSGPQPLSGRPQTVMSDMGAWRVTLTNIQVHDVEDRVRLYRALFFGVLAQGGPIYVPLYDWRRNPRARSGLTPLPAPIPFADATLFSDTASFDPDLLNVSVAIAAFARATSIAVQSTGDPLPTAGEFFGLGERAHMVTASFADTPSVGLTTLQFQPPLRAAVAVGDLLETIDPVCRMQLDAKSLETVLTLDLAVVGNSTLDFYEANWT